jgi:hypothetical protein
MLTCVLPSGRRYGSRPLLRTSARRYASRCASQIGIGMRSSVSSHAYPNIIPWSPAPISSHLSPVPARCSAALSTPMAMSGDCSSIEVITPQVLPSNPYDSRS